MSAEALKIWEERVAQSNGKSIFVPEEFKEKYTELTKLLDDYNEKVRGLAKEEILMKTAWGNFWVEMRKWAEKSGNKNAWEDDLGTDQDAKAQGVDVINFTTPPPSMRG